MKNRRPNLKISVIVAVYNQEHYIGRCLRSLLHQTLHHSDYEIIVVNDGSIDRTSYALDLFCDPFESIVKVLTNKANQGLPSSLNKALKVARAPYIVRVDSDDFVNIRLGIRTADPEPEPETKPEPEPKTEPEPNDEWITV